MRSIALPGRRIQSGTFANIFAYGEIGVEPIPDLASAVRTVRMAHPGGVDLILIGRANEQGMKITRDPFGYITVLIGLPPAALVMFSDGGDEVVVAFGAGALRYAGVIGFLWEGDSTPPESNSTSSKSRLDIKRHLHRLNLT